MWEFIRLNVYYWQVNIGCIETRLKIFCECCRVFVDYNKAAPSYLHTHTDDSLDRFQIANFNHLSLFFPFSSSFILFRFMHNICIYIYIYIFFFSMKWDCCNEVISINLNFHRKNLRLIIQSSLTSAAQSSIYYIIFFIFFFFSFFLI